MKYPSFKALAGCLLLLAAGSATPLLAQTFTGTDVGAPTHHGSATVNADTTISINGGGDDIWNTSDNCFYYYASVPGQVWEAKVRIVSFTGPDFWSKATLMLRRPATVGGAPAGNDPEMLIQATQTSQQNEIRPAWRPTRGAASGDNGGTGISPTYPHQWLRIGRVGSVFRFYESQDNKNWTLTYTRDTTSTANGFDGTAWEDPILLGVAVTAHNDGDATGATAVVSNLVVNPYTQATAMGVVTQIQTSVTVYQYTEASFRFAATNNAVPNDLVPTTYAWYKNNVLISTNPMGPDLTFLTSPADNNAQIYAVASVSPPAPYTSISITSAVATLTVIPPSIIYTNGLKQELFAGAVRTDVESGSVQHGVASRVSAADVGSYGNNYTIRLSGYFIPPTNGAYVFFINGDDDCDLFLSSDSTSANKTLIAQETVWSNPYDWLKSDGGGNFDQKRSDHWSPDGGVTFPFANGFYLTGSNLYWIEALEHQGGGGAELQVTYQTTNEIADPNWATTFTNGSLPRLAGTNGNIALVTSPYTNFTWALQPTNLDVFEGANAQFFSKVSTDSELSPTYQWYVNNAAYPGGTSPNLTLPSVTTTLNAAQIYVVATPAEGGTSITSSIVTLTVEQAVFEAGFAKDERWDNSNRSAVENGSAGTPGYTMGVPGWEVSLDNGGQGNNFARRLTGFFVPPTTGLYVFFVNSDDDSDLFISTDNSPANKRLVAQESGWSNPLQWQGVGGGSTLTQKRSDSFLPNGATTPPFAAGISLNAGQRYYMEQDYSQGGGGANLEATFKLTTDPDPANGAATKMVGNTIGISAVRCSYVAFTTEPAPVTVPPGGFAAFTAVGKTDSQLAIGQVTGGEASYTNNFIFYQWYRNGNKIPGANSSAFVISPVQPSDAGAVISCQIRALGYADATLTPIWSNSTSATLTISPQAVFEPGWALVEWWPTNNPSRLGVETGINGPPAYLFASPRFESAINGEAGDNYVNRVSGYFVAPTTGNFVFFMNSDDDADLYISTNSTPGGKVLVAQEIGYASSALGWSLTGGNGDTLAQRRTDQFTDPNSGLQPYGTGIPMTAGQSYYMETVHHEGGGGDYVAVTYKNFNDADPANGTDSTLFGNVIGFYAPRIPWVAFSQQPQSQTVTSGGSVATFTANGYSAPSIIPGVTGDPRPLFGLPPTNVTFQWYRGGTAISGATASSYTLTPVLPSDNNSHFSVGIRALGYADNTLTPIWSNSVTATLTVVTDTVPPTISYAATFANSNNAAGPLFVIDVTFNKWMDPTTLSNIANYTISGVTITNVSIAANHQTVQLLVNQLPTLPLSVTVNGVKDLSGNQIASNSSAAINTPALTSMDIGSPGVDPAYPSSLWADAANGYIVSAEGSDIWGTADGFNFVWEYKTNDFDVVVRQKYITHTSNWAKGGLMVRETLLAGSRNYNIINDPRSSDGINAPDGSGFGANTIESNARVGTGAASGGWGNLAGGVPPPYPNAWVRLKRVGTVLSCYRASDGMHWVQMGATDVSTNAEGAFPSVVYVGICTTAHNNDPLVGPPPPPFLYYNTVEYANYNSSFVANSQITITHAGGNLNISWSPAGGHVESSPAVAGPNVNWQNIGTSNPMIVPIGTGTLYFRVVNP